MQTPINSNRAGGILGEAAMIRSKRYRLSQLHMGVCGLALLTLAVVLGEVPLASAQVASVSGPQNIAPAYEGWEQNPDGSFNLLFGYLNRNWDEELDVPIGPENRIEPGEPDRGQPTHFLPRRNRFIFRIRVPADFGEQELVWTLTSNGQTERAYGTLKRDYFIDDIVIMNNNGAGGAAGGMYNISENVGPELRVDGNTTRHVRVGQPVALTTHASDDGIPKLRRMPKPRLGLSVGGTPNSASGLRFAWFVYRGSGSVAFDPPQFKVWEDSRPGADSPWAHGWGPPPIPEENKWVVQASFAEAGTYVLRALAHDGGLSSFEDVTFVVEP